MKINSLSFRKITPVLSIATFLIFTPNAQAAYPCPLGFYYANYEGCVPNYNTYSNVVWGTTVAPAGYTYDAAHAYYPAANAYHYNWGTTNYYHNNWGGPAYYRR